MKLDSIPVTGDNYCCSSAGCPLLQMPPRTVCPSAAGCPPAEQPQGTFYLRADCAACPPPSTPPESIVLKTGQGSPQKVEESGALSLASLHTQLPTKCKQTKSVTFNPLHPDAHAQIEHVATR